MVVILSGVRWNLNVALICIFLMARDGEYFFFFFPSIVVLGGGTLWHLHRFLQRIKYIILEFTPSTGVFWPFGLLWF
jgi:hypothetical protein